ncbi:hypothetical protein [Chitinophaga flava]|uniref:Peptidase S74 domain-containing protein n=1 Tax=Chitinophaga flava TaxID=2259036 RepID=A0A365XQV0_9BACT|nr:hypothetical protein [Chitinophaga flava]RBL88510.1 hypothetical protein DF182_18190 [Chitinophaga flava]
MKRIVLFIVICTLSRMTVTAQNGPLKFQDNPLVFYGQDGHWEARQDAFSNLVWKSYSTQYFMINDTYFLQNGNVGIGIPAPTAKLQVAGNIVASELVVLNDPGNNTTPYLSGLTIYNRGASGNSYGWKWQTASVGGGFGVYPNSMELWEYPDVDNSNNCCRGRLKIAKSTGVNVYPQAVVIDGNGNLALGGYTDAGNNTLSVNGSVGIGTNNAQGYRLAVVGSMIAERIKVKSQASWPDFVFHHGYKLPSLATLENYIKENQHLPEIPSAAEVQENGIDVGEMNRKLLQKVEELTLYIIDLQKQVNELKKNQHQDK